MGAIIQAQLPAKEKAPMPFTEFTAQIALPAINTEYSVGTLAPNFDRLDVYVDPGSSVGVSRLIWRLYSTVGGVTVRIAETLPIFSTVAYRPFSFIGTNLSGDPDSGSLFDLRVIAVDLPVPGPGVIAGMCGYDDTVNNQPIEVVATTAPLVFGVPVLFGTLLSHHTNVQVQVNPAAATNVGSFWQIYGQITGAGGPISALVSEGGLQSVSSTILPQVVASATKIGASSYRIYGLLTDQRYSGVPVRASTSGSDPQLDGTGGPPVTLYYQTVEDNGTALTQQPALNFIGATVADNPGNSSTDVTIPSLPTLYYQTVENNGAALTQQPNINFIGATVTDNPGNNSTDITVPSGGITQLTRDVLAGPGAGSQVASVVEATGEITGPGAGVFGWWFPNKAGSIGLCNSPDGTPVSIYRLPGTLGTNPFTAYTVLSADGGNVSLGGGGSVAGPINTSIYAQSSVEIYGTATRLVRKTRGNANNINQSLWQVSQPSQFVAAEVYGGGAAFNCDTGLLATTLIECNFAGGGAGTINLPSNNAGRVLHIADQSSTITVLASLTLQPDAGTSIGGGAVGAPLVVTTTGWAQKLVLNSAGNNWMIF